MSVLSGRGGMGLKSLLLGSIETVLSEHSEEYRLG